MATHTGNTSVYKAKDGVRVVIHLPSGDVETFLPSREVRMLIGALQFELEAREKWEEQAESD
jgi:hypothetical protein